VLLLAVFYLAVLLPEDIGGREGARADPAGQLQLGQKVHVDVRPAQDLRGRLYRGKVEMYILYLQSVLENVWMTTFRNNF
jgi:hypothetical protein